MFKFTFTRENTNVHIIKDRRDKTSQKFFKKYKCYTFTMNSVVKSKF